MSQMYRKKPVTSRKPAAVPTPEQLADYEERAAILEYDAGLSREEAERWAAHWCLGRPLVQPGLWE
jgi:hypothetical protein